MSGKNRFVCSVILVLVIVLSKSQQNSTKNEEKNDNLIRYEIYTNSTANYSDKIKTLRHNLYKKLINNIQYDKMQYKFHKNNNCEDNDSIQHKRDRRALIRIKRKDDKQITMNSHTNSTNVNHKKNFMSQAVRENLFQRIPTTTEAFKNSSKNSNESNIVPSEMCHNDTCIQLCCPLGDRLVEDKCTPEGIDYIFPNVSTNDSMQSDQPVNELFHLAIYDPCQKKEHVMVVEGFQYKFMIFVNGSIYLSSYNIFVKSTSYCLAIVDGDKFEVTFCSETYDEIMKIINNDSTFSDVQIIYTSFQIVSILLLLSIFLVYSILPQLRNKHGFMLRNYSAALSVGYGFDVVNIIIKAKNIPYPICVTIASFIYFCLLAGSFWLFMISLDMWCTFRGFCSLQRNIKQREKRKLMYYTIFAWGCPFIFAVFCVIMDSVSENVPEILRPKFQLGDCWFHGKGVFLLYYFGPKNVCMISSICLFISTILKIIRYEKDIGLRLTDSESKRYNNNKKWFSLNLKLFIIAFIMLFIMMGLKCSLMSVRLLDVHTSSYILFTSCLIDVIQHLCIFIIFVCKKKIKMLLLKRFGCGLFPQARSDTNVTSNTITSEVSMQENTSSNTQGIYHVKSSSDGTEF